MDIKLRDYQKEVLDIIDRLEPGSYLIQMATGLGKTATFTNIKRKGRVLVLAHREELINQIGDLYQYNFNLLCTNREVISDVWREYVKISVKYALQLPVYDFHFFGVKEKTDEDIMLPFKWDYIHKICRRCHKDVTNRGISLKNAWCVMEIGTRF